MANEVHNPKLAIIISCQVTGIIVLCVCMYVYIIGHTPLALSRTNLSEQ